MQVIQLSAVVVVFFFYPTSRAADEVVTPADAAKQEGNAETVMVAFVVKSCHPVLPNGTHFRLFSEESFINEETFVVHLTDKAVARLGAKNLKEYFLGKKVHVRGKVGKIIFSSFVSTRPGIFVDDPARIKVVEEKE